MASFPLKTPIFLTFTFYPKFENVSFAKILQPPTHYARLIIYVKNLRYGLPFSHNTSVTDDTQTGRTTGQLLAKFNKKPSCC